MDEQFLRVRPRRRFAQPKTGDMFPDRDLSRVESPEAIWFVKHNVILLSGNRQDSWHLQATKKGFGKRGDNLIRHTQTNLL